MIDPGTAYAAFLGQGLSRFAGVPDSLLKDFCAYLADHAPSDKHVITANEGNAIALACGHYLGSGEPSVVYMQNSGIGNAVNPLLSLADPDVYGIPMLMLIGWRGEPGVKDEPQHVKQGRRMVELLEAMEIPHLELTAESDIEAVIADAVEKMGRLQGPVVILVRAGTFSGYSLKSKIETDYPLDREGAVKLVVESLRSDDLVVSTTGKTSRELYEFRVERGDSGDTDFLTVGGMGHTSSIAFGLAQVQSNRTVICLDGDGSVLMHMGALAILGASGAGNLLHVVMNNGAHDSVGGQPTVAFGLDLCQVALSCGYAAATSASTPDEIRQQLADLRGGAGPALLEIRVNKGARGDLGRPKSSPAENRDKLMANLGLR